MALSNYKYVIYNLYIKVISPEKINIFLKKITAYELNYTLIHSVPSTKLSERKGVASSSVSSLDHGTLPAKLAPSPVHLYCP